MSRTEKNFLCTGKKGDLIMALYVVKALGGGNLLIGEGFFEEPLENVLESCGKLVASQNYIKSFRVHRGELVDVDLDLWRNSRSLFRKRLLEIICEPYGLKLPASVEPWIVVPPDTRFASKVILHRRTTIVEKRAHPLFDWHHLLAVLGPENCVFVSRLEGEWHQFGYTNVEYYRPKDNYEHACIIKGARYFIGNQSFPQALSDAIGANRILEPSAGKERKHFSVNYADNAWYFASPWDCTLKNFRYLTNGDSSFRDLTTDKMTDRMEPYPFDWKRAWACELGYRAEYLRAIIKQSAKKILGRL